VIHVGGKERENNSKAKGLTSGKFWNVIPPIK
jgi:hypothetical protein